MRVSSRSLSQNLTTPIQYVLTLSVFFYRKGANTVQDLKAQMKAEADRIRIERYKAAEKAAKERAERLKAEAAAKAVAPSTADSKRSPSQVAAAASTPYDSSAPVSTQKP